MSRHLSNSLRRLNPAFYRTPLLRILPNTFSSTPLPPPLPPFTPLLSAPSPSLSAAVTSAFSQWFLSHPSNSSNSLLDRIYSALASTSDEHTLDHSLSSLDPPLSESFLLSFLSHKPFLDSAIHDSNELLLLKLRFFDWSGRRKPYRHSRSVYHALFQLLKKSNKSPLILQWLQLFSTSHKPSRLPHPHPHPSFYDTLVIGYAVAGKPEIALGIFGRIRFSGLMLQTFTIRVLLNSLVENSLFSFCDSLFPLLPRTDPIAVSIRIKAMCMRKNLGSAESLLRSLPSRLAAREVPACVLVTAFCKRGKYAKARKVVDDFPSGDVYRVWLNCLVKKGKLSEAMGFLADKKVKEDYIPDSTVYCSLIMRLLRGNHLSEAYDLLAEMMEEGIPPTRVTMSAALRFFCKAGFVDVALNLYRSRRELGIDPGGPTFDHLIRALCADGDYDRAYNVVGDSMRKGHFPGRQAFATLARALCRKVKLNQVRTLLDAAVQQEVRPAADILARYMAALCKVGNLTEACLVPHTGKDSVGTMESMYKHKSTYISMIRAFALLDRIDTLPRLVIEMQEMGHVPSRNLYRTVIVSLCKMHRYGDVLGLLSEQLQRRNLDERTCYHYFIYGAAHAGTPDLAREIYNRMVSAGIEPNWESELFLLHGYLKSSKISDALNFFEFLRGRKEPTTKMYNVMIVGLCRASLPDQAVDFWKEAREKKLIPSLESYEQLSLALGSVKDYTTLVKVLDDFRETGRPVTAFLCNVVLSHTLKNRDLLRVWFKLREESKDTDSYGAELNELPHNQSSARMLLGQLIAAFSGGIRTKENLDKVAEEYEKYFPMDLYTYNMLLRAFAVERRMDLARELFNRMYEKGYWPNRWSFDTMVLGFCKVGDKGEAERWRDAMSRNGFSPTQHTMRLLSITS
ncbi:Pentatricopeptide repeat-containing protein [Rhynchospora pubera]|uniref:Pentatricopeptide repeat-containing protein n=1 Tax=Rhynchospora pubera TaxID=906938 RepID=A0AAV8CR69_9POAL|nr:Pentatricopeptide repeat-containing protein [Rhynchospora pubera]